MIIRPVMMNVCILFCNIFSKYIIIHVPHFIDVTNKEKMADLKKSRWLETNRHAPDWRQIYTQQSWECMRVFVFYATIFQLYMWRHRCAGGLKKLYLRSGSQRHRHFVGFFNVPVLYWHGATLFVRLFRETAPFSRLLRHAGDTDDVFSS